MGNKQISIKSIAWQQIDKNKIATVLFDRGFRYAEEVMNIRTFDLLNIFKINAGIAGEAILILYSLYNPNPIEDEGMDYHMIDQRFPFSVWRKEHKDLSQLIIRDLVMAEDINRRAIKRIWNRICKAFWMSDEYNCREYRYWSYQQLKRERGLKNE